MIFAWTRCATSGSRTPTSAFCWRPRRAPANGASGFSLPLIWAAAAMGWVPSIQDTEVRQKLSLFVRSRWFKPPLDGRVMAGLMYDAMTSMGAAQNAASLASSFRANHSICS